MAQKDPLVEYTSEGEQMFTELGRAIRGEVVLHLFHAELAPAGGSRSSSQQNENGGNLQYEHETTAGRAGDRAGGRRRPSRPRRGATQTIQASPHEKLGRNEPCWCGSGKKFKKCHGA